MSLADAFFALHGRGTPFVLPNAWDPPSACVYERAGFPAVATSSAAMAWTLGYADGEAVDTAELFAAIARLVRAVGVPVSADLEAGFGATPAAVVHTFERALSTGVVGANLEDYDNAARDVLPIDDAVVRIRAVRARADALRVRFFVNARTDILLHGLGPVETRVDRTIERLRAFAAAGADGVFAPGVSDAPTIERIARAVDAPLNVLVTAQTPSLAELARCGVARVTVGSSPMRRTLGVLATLAQQLRDGSFAFAGEPALSFAECNAFFARAGR